MKRVLIDLEENGCTVKEAVDYLKWLGYHESDGVAIPYNAVVVCGYSGGEIIGFIDGEFSLKRFYEKLTIKESTIVFQNPLMQHIGREVVVNDGEGNFSGWVIDVCGGDLSDMLVVDIGVMLFNYTHSGKGVGLGEGTLRWFNPRNVKFVNDGGSLSDE